MRKLKEFKKSYKFSSQYHDRKLFFKMVGIRTWKLESFITIARIAYRQLDTTIYNNGIITPNMFRRAKLKIPITSNENYTPMSIMLCCASDFNTIFL